MPRRHLTRTVLLHIFLEAFFALLPLVVLAAVWSHSIRSPEESFWSGPEMSMTSCILYGLTLARLLQGAVMGAGRSRSHAAGDIHEVAVVYAALVLFPLLGVIVSVILIARSMLFPSTWQSILNLAIAIVCMVIVGGHAIKAMEQAD